MNEWSKVRLREKTSPRLTELDASKPDIAHAALQLLMSFLVSLRTKIHKAILGFCLRFHVLSSIQSEKERVSHRKLVNYPKRDLRRQWSSSRMLAK